MPSTVVSHFHYNKYERTLTITFTSGIIYYYKNVPENVYIEMKAAFSKGIYFNQHIKGFYEFEKVEK